MKLFICTLLMALMVGCGSPDIEIETVDVITPDRNTSTDGEFKAVR